MNTRAIGAMENSRYPGDFSFCCNDHIGIRELRKWCRCGVWWNGVGHFESSQIGAPTLIHSTQFTEDAYFIGLGLSCRGGFRDGP